MIPKVWVAGGTSGIGEATADLLLQSGMDVVATGLENDVRSPIGLMHFLQITGPFTHVVYSAGINVLRWISDLDKDHMFKELLDTNVVGFGYVLAALSRYNGEVAPRVVAVTSDAAVRPMRASLAYCASKAALDMAVRVAAREKGPAGWRVNAVAPGMTEPTEMQRQLDEDIPRIRNWSTDKARSYEESQNPLRRRAQVGEVAEVIRDVLLGPDYLNGAVVTVNGGR